MVKMSGGEALVKSLVREGVEVVFGIPGIHMSGTIAALRDEPGIRMITTRHEAGATHMADGYSRASGKPGSSLSGPGCGCLQCRLRPGHCIRPLLTRAANCRPDPPGPDRQGPWGHTRSLRPVRRDEPRHQVAAAGAQAQGGPRLRDRSIQADAYRPSSSRSARTRPPSRE